jgi:ferredoxin-NADP reductase/fatty acid desaturase
MSITSNNLQMREIINQVVRDPAYKKVAAVPLISIPQVSLLLLAYTGVFGGMALHVFGGASLWWVYPIMIFCFYSAFTPLHDATHRAVSSDKALNDLLGTLSGMLLFPMVTTRVYRFLHLAHHRYVGDKELDPDEAMVAIPTKYFPFGYLVLLAPEVLWVKWLLVKAWERTPGKTRVGVVVMIAGNIIFHAAWLMSPYWYEYLTLFFIPNRIAIWYTAFTFAHSPHPEGLKWNDYPFQSTFQLKGNKYFLETLFGQDHHAMHHFMPHVPWYKYHKVWGLANGAFRKQHIPQKDLFSIPDPDYKNKIAKVDTNKWEMPFKVRVADKKQVAKNIKTFTFESFHQGQLLPRFSAGSHINIHLPSGKIRSYSLVNPPYEKHRYQVAVKLEENGKGGSLEMHEQVSIGDTLQISRPRNNFLLYENAKNYILISGGIGITPMISMAHRLAELDQHFEFHICAKKEDEIPFSFELRNWSFAPNIEFHLDKNDRSSIDLSKVLAAPNDHTLIYICGPSGFNKWVNNTALNMGWSESQIKQELFINNNAALLEPKAFQLTLSKSNKTIEVEKDQTIIDALHHHNIEVSYSCLQGTCGTCVSTVLEGEVDHRDAFLSEEEKMANNKMCICVSRGKGDSLMLDL